MTSKTVLIQLFFVFSALGATGAAAAPLSTQNLLGGFTGRTFNNASDCTVSASIASDRLVITIATGDNTFTLSQLKVSDVDAAIRAGIGADYPAFIIYAPTNPFDPQENEWYLNGSFSDAGALVSAAIVHNWVDGPMAFFGAHQESADCGTQAP